MDLLPLVILAIAALAASTISSLAGFGGSLLLLPVLVHVFGPGIAIPVFTVAGLISNSARAFLGGSVIAWRTVGAFVAGAVPGAVAGAIAFVEIPAVVVQKLLAVFLIVLMVIRKTLLRRSWPLWALPLAGAASAFLSGVFGFSGPLTAAIFFSMGLSPASYIASEATAAMFVHLTKAVTYQRFDALSSETVAWGMAVGGVMAVGAWIGRLVIDKIPHERHSVVVRMLFVVVALSLLI